MPKLSVIVPCYGNGPQISALVARLWQAERSLGDGASWEYIFVDDGSRDDTFAELSKVKTAYPGKVTIIKLTRNFGAYIAVIAGLGHASGDCCVVMPADLQDPPELVQQMYLRWTEGFKLVVATPVARYDPPLRAALARLHHFLMIHLVFRHAPREGFDFMLFDRHVRDQILRIRGRHTYLPYLLMWLGHEYAKIPYTRERRSQGSSTWTFAKRLRAVSDSWIGFSLIPIRIVQGLGVALLLAACVSAGFALNATGVLAPDRGRWIVTVVLLVAALHLLALGVIGEYLQRVLEAGTDRPLFVIDRIL